MEAWSTLKGTKKLVLFQDHLLSYFQFGFFQPNIPGTAIGSPPNSKMAEREETLKEVWHEIFIFKFFLWISVPRAPECPILFRFFFENSLMNVYQRWSRKSRVRLPSSFAFGWMNATRQERVYLHGHFSVLSPKSIEIQINMDIFCK